ncbi:MAG: hypothetical protein JW963_18960 [Anaerolineales bacterium]|nr:hypothetical protein [Anaerolineales bacterium]
MLDKQRLDRNGGMQVATESGGDRGPISILTITVDQAGLQGLLRHLYSLGLSLISVICIDYP